MRKKTGAIAIVIAIIIMGGVAYFWLKPSFEPSTPMGLTTSSPVISDTFTVSSDNTSPSPPTGLKAELVSPSQIDLDWNDNPENDLDHYNVYRSTDGDFVCDRSTLVARISSSQYSDNGLSPGTTYYYKVTAVNTSGNESNPLSIPFTWVIDSQDKWENTTLESQNISIRSGILTLMDTTHKGSWISKPLGMENREIKLDSIHVKLNDNFWNWQVLGANPDFRGADSPELLYLGDDTEYPYRCLVNGHTAYGATIQFYKSRDCENWILEYKHAIHTSGGLMNAVVRGPDNRYYVYMSNGPGENVDTWTEVAVSEPNDLENWTMLGKQFDYTDVGAFYDPEDGLFHLFPEIYPTPDQPCGNGLAHATSPNGIENWTVPNPVLDTRDLSWHTGDPDIIKIDNTYHFFFDNTVQHPYYAIGWGTTDNLYKPIQIRGEAIPIERHGDPTVTYAPTQHAFYMYMEWQPWYAKSPWIPASTQLTVDVDTDGDGTTEENLRFDLIEEEPEVYGEGDILHIFNENPDPSSLPAGRGFKLGFDLEGSWSGVKSIEINGHKLGSDEASATTPRGGGVPIIPMIAGIVAIVVVVGVLVWRKRK